MCRFQLALQQNAIMNVFYDDWVNLGDSDDAFGSKADSHLKVWTLLWCCVLLMIVSVWLGCVGVKYENTQTHTKQIQILFLCACAQTCYRTQT